MQEGNALALFDDLNNLEVASKIEAPPGWRPAVNFDSGSGMGEATTQGLTSPPNFSEFLASRGYDPNAYEVINNSIRTSMWQQREDGDWLTSYRFYFRMKNAELDLPLLWATAKKNIKKKPLAVNTPQALVILFSDPQVGKVDHRGGTAELIERLERIKAKLIAQVKKVKPSKIVFCDVGDIIESFSNSADMQQLATNDLSLMQQVDLSVSIVWDFLKALAALVPEVTYATVASNHCQNRIKGQKVGKPGQDDWGIFIGRTLARLAQETNLPVKFIQPHPQDESLAHDVFGDGYHILGLWHGHQSPRPDAVPDFWRKQSFGRQPIAGATIGVSGHFHHLRVQELGSTPNGSSRFWIQAATLDNGSGWFRLNNGEDSQAGLVTFVLEASQPFTGTVYKL
jgi:hypothetical protein